MLLELEESLCDESVWFINIGLIRLRSGTVEVMCYMGGGRS